MSSPAHAAFQQAKSTLQHLATLSPPDAIESLLHIKQVVGTLGKPELLEALARSLPKQVHTLVPEVSMALSRVAMSLAPYHPVLPGDTHMLPPPLRRVWWQVHIAAGIDVALLPEEPILKQVVSGWSIDAIPEPFEILEHMARAEDPGLRSWALKQLPNAIEQIAITPEQAFTCLAHLARDTELGTRLEALQMLTACWLFRVSPAAAKQRETLVHHALADDHVCLVDAALDAASSLQMREALLAFLNTQRHKALKTKALQILGKMAFEQDLDPILAQAQEDPLGMGPGTRLFMLEAHRRGIFARERHLPVLLNLFRKHPLWTGAEFVRVTYIVRKPLIQHLYSIPPNDPAWLRHADILATNTEPEAAQLLIPRPVKHLCYSVSFLMRRRTHATQTSV